ncbi:hypothetical protein Q31b_20930 [Novipirellula aureliae]|uniref:Xylose isomerase-like TIM barrel n=1 Tax=Novipirellula aureliae TaxID=2527966 RepID=A0A5C6E6H1_9BACT|nr:metabolite traffic protein EboE [Novipirellula aureliae]TWU43056.1 hypothetical protein Q31b_20930 [Novipirellula aureliae]
MSFTIGYCTNIHAGVDRAAIRENLQKYSTAVYQNLTGDQPLPIGLWLPAKAAGELAGNGPETSNPETTELKQFMASRHLEAYTINGFPYDNFHQPVVKHGVYEPAWWDDRRLTYTKQLACILIDLLPDSQTTGTQRLGTISTLPIGWRSSAVTAKQLEDAGKNLRSLADFLQSLESRTGSRIVVALEPEPGCLLETTKDVKDWFETQLPDAVHRRHLSVCHDICHSAVMMESQTSVLNGYGEAGIEIGKVQVSNAVVADWDSMAMGRRREAIEQLAEFAEDRYLHQTGCEKADGSFELVEDLPALLRRVRSKGDPVDGDLRWVVHFHVPIFLERFGHLSTSQADVYECIELLQKNESASSKTFHFSGHIEIETYAWSVLPPAMRKRELAQDIAAEIGWLRKEMAAQL